MCDADYVIGMLKTEPEPELTDFDEAIAVVTTPFKWLDTLLGGHLGAGWQDTGCYATGVGIPVRNAQHSSDGFWTIDLALSSFNVGGVSPNLSPKRYLRLELRPGTEAHRIAWHEQITPQHWVTFGGPAKTDHSNEFLEVHPDTQFRIKFMPYVKPLEPVFTQKAYVRLLTLRCNETTEWSNDEPYIWINGDQKWPPPGTEIEMGDGETRDLRTEVDMYGFSDAAWIALREDDALLTLGDDEIGTAVARESMAGLGPKTVPLTGDGGNYDLEFEVVLARSGPTKEQYVVITSPEDRTPPMRREESAIINSMDAGDTPIVINEASTEIHRIGCEWLARTAIEHRTPRSGAMDGSLALGYVLDQYDGCAFCSPTFHYK